MQEKNLKIKLCTEINDKQTTVIYQIETIEKINNNNNVKILDSILDNLFKETKLIILIELMKQNYISEIDVYIKYIKNIISNLNTIDNDYVLYICETIENNCKTLDDINKLLLEKINNDLDIKNMHFLITCRRWLDEFKIKLEESKNV